MPVEYEVVGNALRFNCLNWVIAPSIEDSEATMAIVIDKLLEVKDVDRIILAETRENEYDYYQTKILREIANAYNKILNEDKILSLSNLGLRGFEKFFPKRLADLQFLVLEVLRKDPIGAYMKINMMINQIQKLMETAPLQQREDYNHYLTHALIPIKKILENTTLIKLVKPKISKFKFGDRSLYREIFSPVIRPNFMLTRYMLATPKFGRLVDKYYVGTTLVEIFKVPGKVRFVYHVSPQEFLLSEEKYSILDQARRYLAAHRPAETEFTEPERARELFLNIGRGLIKDLARNINLVLTEKEIEELASILTRYTAGFGVLEILLADEKIQDIYINPPLGSSPIFIFHSDFEECETNLIPTIEDAEAWATRFRLYSGRPLDEANPVLDTELLVPGGRARVAAITKTLSPYGLGFAFRRHREKPWTFPLFMKVKYFDPLYAGLMSFIIDGGRALLIAGGRSSGKCLSGESFVQLSDGSLIQLRKLVCNLFKTQKPVKFSDGEIVFPENLKVITLDSNLKLKTTNVVAVWKRFSPEYLFEISTRSGRKVRVTPEHPFISTKGGAIINIRADEIKKGMRIAVPRFLPLEKGIKQNFGIANIPEGCKVITLDNEIWFKGKNDSEFVKLPNLDKNFMAFLGYVFGDGSINGNGIVFHSNKSALRKRFLYLCEKVFGVNGKEEPIEKPVMVNLRSRAIVKFLKKLGIRWGKKTRVALPSKFMNLKKGLVKFFIQAYFDCDATVDKTNREIEFCTINKEMFEQMQSLLLSFGIFCMADEKRREGEKYYRIKIRGNNINKYGKIGFFCPLKSKKLALLLKKDLKHSTCDIIPDAEELLLKVTEKLRIRLPESLRSFIPSKTDIHEKAKRNLTKEKLKVFIKIIKKRQDEILKLSKDIEELKNYKISLLAAKNLSKELTLLLNYLSIPLSELSKYIRINPKIYKECLEGRISNLKIAKRIYEAALNFIIFRIRRFYGNTESFASFHQDNLFTFTGVPREIVTPESSLKYNFFNLSAGLVKKRIAINDLLNDSSKPWNENVDCVEKKIEDLKILLDVIDDFDPTQKIKNVLKKLNIKVRNFYHLTSHKHTPTTFLEFIDHIETVWSEMKTKEVEESINKLEFLANSDVIWDEVKSARKVKSKEKYVYDLTVEPTHNFIANGIIVHNTSLLNAMMLEIMRKFRIIVQEDTLELSVPLMQQLGYNIGRLKTRSVITRVEAEMPADEALRTALRLGDSVLIVGEIRSVEGKALFEAMRIGALANVVAGTIHGESAYGVYDRVVNDLGVQPTSFKAIDLITICNMLKSPDGLHRFRRVIELTEVRKHWKHDPLDENGFVPLMVYSSKEDRLKPTDTLIDGESFVLNEIAKRVREWHGAWDLVWDNILLRARIKEAMVKYANELNRPEILEADWVCDSNEAFHLICDDVRQEVGAIDSKMVYERWLEWFKEKLKGRA